MAGLFDSLHIKGRTAGSSNELSFDVLDAARRDLDSKQGRTQRGKQSRSINIPTGPRTSQGNYEGVGKTSTLSAITEVERRKRARRSRAVRLWVIGIIVLVAIAGAGGYLGFRYYQDNVNFAGRFGTLVKSFTDTDKTLVVVDSLMTDPLSATKASNRSAVQGEFETVEESLDRIIDQARSMASEEASADATALAQVEVSAKARKDMLSAASGAFKVAEIESRQVADATNAWNKVLAGDELAREATELANTATTEAQTTAARDKTAEALASMQAAREQLLVVERGTTGLSFRAEIAYVDKRIESLEAAIETSDALLAGNRELALSANTTYNATDAEAAQLAAELPASISEQVKDAYRPQIEEMKEAYNQARTTVTNADSVLRSYLR